ncbi:MAG: type II secretion system F family protein, partial [bacterium]
MANHFADDDDLTPYELDMPAAPEEETGGSTFKPAVGGKKPRPADAPADGTFRPAPKKTAMPADSDAASTFRPAPSAKPKREPSFSRSSNDEMPSESPRPLKSKKKSRDDYDQTEEEFIDSGGPTLVERILYGRVGTKQLAIFYRQMSQYLLAGLDLPMALKGAQKQFRHKALGPVIARMQDGVMTGRSMAEVFEREPQAFDRLAVNMIRAADSRGAVPEILKELADIQEFRARTVKNIASASIYPMIVLTIATLCLLIITVFVGPLFNGVIGDLIPPNKRDSLIMPTRLLFAMNEALMVLGPLMPIFVIFGTVLGIWLAYKTEAGRTILDELYWYVPIFGKIQKFIDLSRMGRMLGALLESGVATPQALALTAGVVRLKPFERVLLKAEAATKEGDEIAPVFAESGRFPYEVIGLIETGETTGKLPYSLQKIGTDYEERATMIIKNLSTLIQPLVTVFLGLIVGFIAIAFVGLIAGLYSGLATGAL